MTIMSLLGLYVKKSGLQYTIKSVMKHYITHRLFKTDVGFKEVLYLCSFSKNLS